MPDPYKDEVCEIPFSTFESPSLTERVSRCQSNGSGTRVNPQEQSDSRGIETKVQEGCLTQEPSLGSKTMTQSRPESLAQ
jgi:hypothetical protein